MIVGDMICGEPPVSFAAHARMAAAIVDTTAVRGACRPRDLLAAGFTREETSQLWPVAHALAAIVRLMDVL